MKLVSKEIQEKLDAEKSAEEEKEKSEENYLEFATMGKKERRAAKKEQYNLMTADMTKEEKRAYFFSYYKWYFITPAICIVFALWIFLAIKNNMRPIGLSYAIVNAENADTVDTGFYSSYAEFNNLDGNYRELSDFHFQIDYNDYMEREAALLSSTSSNYFDLTSNCQKGDYDIVIGDLSCLMTLAHIGVINPLNEYLDADMLDKLKNHLAYAVDYYGDSFPYAIDISDTSLSRSLNVGYDKVYIMLPGTLETNKKNAGNFIEYLLNKVFITPYVIY